MGKARWAVLVSGSCLVLAAVAVAYAAGQVQAAKVLTADVVRAKRVEIVDPAGRVRVVLDAAATESSLVLLDKEGKVLWQVPGPGGAGAGSSSMPSGPAGRQAKQQAPAETITITNSTASDKGFGMWEVVGEVTNNDSVQHSAMLRATFYDGRGKIMGTALGAVNDLAAGSTKTFSLVTTDDIAGYTTMKVQVDTLM